MAHKKKKNLLVFRFPKPSSEREHSQVKRLFDNMEGRQDFHILFLFEGRGRKVLEIEEFGAVTANGSSLRKVQESLQRQLDAEGLAHIIDKTKDLVTHVVDQGFRIEHGFPRPAEVSLEGEVEDLKKMGLERPRFISKFREAADKRKAELDRNRMGDLEE